MADDEETQTPLLVPPKAMDFTPGHWGIDPQKLGKMPTRPRRGAGVANVIGAEDRMQIGVTDAEPWRLICSLIYHRNGEVRSAGTGTLIGPRLVLTAGHCLDDDPDEIEVIPGRGPGGEKPFGSVRVKPSAFRAHPAWQNNRREERDAGALVLDAPFQGVDTWFRIANRSDDDLIGWFVSIAGYPEIRPALDPFAHRYDGGDELWFHSNALTDVRPYELHYGVDTTAGQSGSSVWLYDDGQPTVVGVHAYGSRRKNFATRIDDDLITHIGAWAADGA